MIFDYAADCAYGERLDKLTDEILAVMYADDASIEEAIGQNADLILAAVRKLHEDRDMDAFTKAFDAAVNSHLEPIARDAAERAI
ncbi:MAG: hypothetical protein ACK5X3_21610 [Pseudomonadota bacterium]